MTASVPSIGRAASPFAHLARPQTPVAASDDDKKDKENAAAADDGDGDGDEDKKKDDAKKSKSKKAEDNDDSDGDDDSAKKSKADGGDDDDEEMKAEGDDDSDRDDDKDKKSRAARARERGRIRAILLSEPGKANPAAAAHLATGTSMSRQAAVEMLAAINLSTASAAAPVKPAARESLRDRMAATPAPDVGAGGDTAPPEGPAALAAKIVASAKKARGEQ